MSNLFFYGTLCHYPLLEVVLGRKGDDLGATEAILPDHASYWAAGQVYPMILPEPGGMAQGVLVRDVSDEDLNRLSFYESAFTYDLRPVQVIVNGQAEPAEVYFPIGDVGQPGDPWSLSDWQAQWGRLSTYAAEEVMSAYGRYSAEEVNRSFPAIRIRANSRIMAEARPADPNYDLSKDVINHGRKLEGLNWFGLGSMHLQHRQYDGTMGPVLSRGALLQGEAAVVLPYDPVRDCVLIVEQFRTPVYMVGDRAPWMWEAIAGMIDPGESPQTAALREAREEAEIDIKRLEYAGGAYSSSGSSTEFIHLYVGLADLTHTVTSAGADGEGEDIRSQILSFEELMDQIDGHKLKDLPLISASLWLARHRDRLREG